MSQRQNATSSCAAGTPSSTICITAFRAAVSAQCACISTSHSASPPTPSGCVRTAFAAASRERRTLCIASLIGLSLFSFAFAVLSYGGWRALAVHLGSQAEHCLIAVPIILFVSSAIASFSHVELNSIPHTLRWINHLLFAALKTSLALLLTFLLSVCLSRPLYIPLPHAADLLQILFFVLFALLAVRWCFHDQEQRCKHCLCSLATPARVGRPSHNLLEWTGTEQTCKQGHGRLSVPEIETSWHQYSRWIDQTSSLDRIASA